MRVVNLILTALFVFTMSSYFQADTSHPLTVSIKLEKEYQRKFANTKLSKRIYGIKGDTLFQTKYDIQINLNNNSEKSVFIWLMTCSWLDNFLVNNEYIDLEGQGCDSNFPHLVEIKSGETKSYFTTISRDIKFENDKGKGNWPQVLTTKLGLITIVNLHDPKFENTFGYYSAMEDKSCWNIIWSNPLYLLSEKEATPDPIEFDIRN